MLRPSLADPRESVPLLIRHLEETDYEFLADHIDILESAIIFVCRTHEEIGGFIWYYQSESDETHWIVHMSVCESYQRRFFSRHLITSMFGACYALGANVIIAEDASQELLARIGGKYHDGEVILELPFIWR